MSRRFKSILLTIIIAFITLSFSGSVDAKSIKEKGSFESRTNVLEGAQSYTPNINEYPFSEDEYESSSINEIWGPSKSLNQYLGEIPYSIKDEEGMSKYRYYNGKKIDGKKRKWSTDSGIEVDDINDSDDLHIRAHSESPDKSLLGLSYGRGEFAVFHFIHGAATLVLDLAFKIKDVDIGSILDMINVGDNLRTSLNSLFLFKEDGTLSPFLTIMIAIYIFSLIGAIYGIAKGEKSGQIILREVGFFILAGLIAGLALTQNGQMSIAKWGVNLSTTLSNDIVSSATEGAELFVYSTGNDTKDSSMTQLALLKKPYVDSIIAMQFGVSAKDLEIKNSRGRYTSNFGSGTSEAIGKTFANGVDFEVDSGSGPVHNLGYYWWTANSSVNSAEPIKSNGSVKTASNDRVLYIIDFLNNAREIAVERGESDVVAKIDRIYESFVEPSWSSGTASMVLLTFLKVAMLIATFLIIIFMSVGKLIIVVGAFAIPVLVGLTLISKTRPMAKDLIKTYIMGFVRFITGLIMINIIVSIVATLSMKGNEGIIVSIIVTMLFAKFVPSIMMELNRQISKGDPSFMNGLNAAYIGQARKMQNFKPVRSAVGRLRSKDSGVSESDGESDNKSELCEKCGSSPCTCVSEGKGREDTKCSKCNEIPCVCDNCIVCGQNPCECSKDESEDNCKKCGQNPCICAVAGDGDDSETCLRCNKDPCVCGEDEATNGICKDCNSSPCICDIKSDDDDDDDDDISSGKCVMCNEKPCVCPPGEGMPEENEKCEECGKTPCVCGSGTDSESKMVIDSEVGAASGKRKDISIEEPDESTEEETDDSDSDEKTIKLDPSKLENDEEASGAATGRRKDISGEDTEDSDKEDSKNENSEEKSIKLDPSKLENDEETNAASGRRKDIPSEDTEEIDRVDTKNDNPEGKSIKLDPSKIKNDEETGDAASGRKKNSSSEEVGRGERDTKDNSSKEKSIKLDPSNLESGEPDKGTASGKRKDASDKSKTNNDSDNVKSDPKSIKLDPSDLKNEGNPKAAASGAGKNRSKPSDTKGSRKPETNSRNNKEPKTKNTKADSSNIKIDMKNDMKDSSMKSEMKDSSSKPERDNIKLDPSSFSSNNVAGATNEVKDSDRASREISETDIREGR